MVASFTQAQFDFYILMNYVNAICICAFWHLLYVHGMNCVSHKVTNCDLYPKIMRPGYVVMSHLVSD